LRAHDKLLKAAAAQWHLAQMRPRREATMRAPLLSRPWLGAEAARTADAAAEATPSYALAADRCLRCRARDNSGDQDHVTSHRLGDDASRDVLARLLVLCP